MSVILGLLFLISGHLVEPKVTSDVILNSITTDFGRANLSDVRYLLWTRSNPGDAEYYLLAPGNLQNLVASPFDGNLNAYFYYHGYNDDGEEDWILNAKSDHLTFEECNVISVDYGELAQSPNYLQSVDNMYQVANLTAGYIDWLVAETALTVSAIHITGHSLGAHAAGMTGFYVQSGLVSRVTGLDAAKALFENYPEDERISPQDAEFVDIIHTNGCDGNGCVAMMESIGHVDFFPNGGEFQPGCPSVNQTIQNDTETGCSHYRSTALWVESILGSNYNGTLVPFTAWPCSDWGTFDQGGCPDCGQGCLNMGYHTARNLTGDYFLRTRDSSPYAIGDNQDYPQYTLVQIQ